jgi:hypothetical protein
VSAAASARAGDVGLHTYCIVPAGLAPPPGLCGIDGAPVTAVPCPPLACWVSAHDDRPTADAGAVRTHNAVAVAAMDRVTTPVPARFGQWFADAPGVAAEVARQADQWLELLQRFAGHAEYGVAVARAGSAAESARDVHPVRVESGTAYMKALVRREADATRHRREAADLAAWLRALVGPLTRDHRVSPRAGTTGLLSIADLVAWDDAPAYHEALEGARRSRTELRFVFTGPWPPYSFVS